MDQNRPLIDLRSNVGVVIGMTRFIPEVENFPQPPTPQPIQRSSTGGESQKTDQICFGYTIVNELKLKLMLGI